MTLYHDAYRFNAAQFLATVSPLLAGSALEVYPRLRERALTAYATQAQVRKLADEYGGWTEMAILEEWPQDMAAASDDFAFWLSLLLYGSFVDGESIGLGTQWRRLEDELATSGWSTIDTGMLVFGRSFDVAARLADNLPEPQEWVQHAGILDALRPASAGGRAGWLSRDDCRQLAKRLTADRDDGAQGEAYARAIAMLQAADTSGTDLCLILSG